MQLKICSGSYKMASDLASGAAAPGTMDNYDPAPTPAQTDAAAWALIAETATRKRCAGARALSAWLRDTAHAAQTPKNDDRTNIIDQDARTTYAFEPRLVSTLFAHLEACRLEGTTAHFSERQGTLAEPATGLMLDYDIVTRLRQPLLTDRLYYRFAGALAAALQRDVNFVPAAVGSASGFGPAGQTEQRLHMFFIIKPEAVALPQAAGQASGQVSSPASSLASGQASGQSSGQASGQSSGQASPQPASQLYKYGLHILVPGVRLPRAYKKYLLRQFRAEPGVCAALAELGAVGEPAECLDQNSASVPVLFFGSCKRGGTPYVLGAALEVTIDLASSAGAGWVAPPVIRRLAPADLAGYNLVAELSLTYGAEYADGRAPLVAKRTYDCRAEIAPAVGDWADRAAGGAVADGALLLAEHSLSTLTLHNAEARHLHQLLDLLPAEYSREYSKWRDVVFALANTSDQYKPLAVWFSQKSAQQWADGGAAALDTLWDSALGRGGPPAGGPDDGGPNAGAVVAPVSVRSIAYWARTADPARYAEAMERSYFTILTGFVYEHSGRLQHYMVAKVLHAMLGAKFCVDIDIGPRGALSYCWFEFVLPGQQMRPGEVWKWRREVEPDDIHIYMSEKLSRVLDQISEHLEEKRGAAGDEGGARYYRDLAKSFAISKGSLYNDAFKNGVIRQAGYLFRRRGFVETLDKLPGLFGTLNGVLRVGPRCALIDHFHEYPVSRFSPVAWKPFNPADPWTKLALDAIADIIVEPDARDWILFHAAQGLSGDPKEGLLLMWEGGGQNGKTSFLRWVAKALGPYADKFNIQLMCSDREDADRPNSAMMRFKNLNYAYSEESNKSQSLNVARMKEMVNAGEVSGRDLNSKQETFTMRANLVAASQYSFIVNTTDHGTWRRLRHYVSKARFRRDPDPGNPYEKPDDQRFVREYPSDPQFQASILSILSHYYERLQNEYRGELKLVRAPTIDGETDRFRVGQDSLHRWICNNVVASPTDATDYTLSALSSTYSEWYSANVERRALAAGGTIKEIESSALSKYLKPGLNGALILRGCRVLTSADTTLRDGEEFLTQAEARGGRTAAQIEAEIAAAKADPRPWWAAREPAVQARAAAEPGITFNDDAQLCRAGRAARPARARAARDGPLESITESEMAELFALVEDGVEPRAPYGLDELYGSGGNADSVSDISDGVSDGVSDGELVDLDE